LLTPPIGVVYYNLLKPADSGGFLRVSRFVFGPEGAQYYGLKHLLEGIVDQMFSVIMLQQAGILALTAITE
jgi:hypothetical protein